MWKEYGSAIFLTKWAKNSLMRGMLTLAYGASLCGCRNTATLCNFSLA